MIEVEKCVLLERGIDSVFPCQGSGCLCGRVCEVKSEHEIEKGREVFGLRNGFKGIGRVRQKWMLQ